jgi:N-acetylneuraminic acid mutarotase
VIRTNAQRHRANALAFLVLLAIGLFTTTTPPALAQASGTWTTTGSLNTPRESHTATLLQNGRVLVTGGEDTGGTILASAELYDRASGKWTVTGSMATPRVGHTATLLPNGEVLVAGGYHQGIYTAAAELYNPATGQWSTTGAMTMSRGFHGATLLETGEALVAGGDSTDGSPHDTAELYDPSAGTWKATGSTRALLLPHSSRWLYSESGKVERYIQIALEL